MGKLVYMEVAAERRKATIEQAWEKFVEAQRVSKETLRLQDGIAAGRAYREFLELCARPS